MLHAGDRLPETIRDLVRGSIASQGVGTTEECEFYLVSLLADRVGDPAGAKAPLAFRALAAAEEADPRRTLRRLGDDALFVAGVFPDSLTRSLVQADYYAAMGRTAYARVSSLEDRAALAALFAELAGKFGALCDVLNEVAARGNLGAVPNLLALYERFLRTGSDRARRLLAAEGILPAAVDPKIIQ